MKHVLAVLAVVLFLLPVGASAATNVPAVADGSFNIYHSGGGNEGYGNAGQSSTFRLSKSHQHMGWIDFGGEGLANAVAAAPAGWEAFVWVKAETGLGNKTGIVTIRTSNVGEIVEDYGQSGLDAGADMTGIPNTSQAVAFRMADTYLSPPPNYGVANTGAGIEQEGAAAFAGVPWKRPSTGAVGGSRSGTPRFYPGNDCVSGTAPDRTGFWDNELFAVEAVVGFHWSQASNTVAKFEEAGQLVNKTDAGDFRWLDGTAAQTDGWYKIKLNNDIVLDMVNNNENKGIVFSSWVAGGSVNWGAPAYGNDVIYSHEHQGGAVAPYLEITPEPATMVLLALGGLALLRRRTA